MLRRYHFKYCLQSGGGKEKIYYGLDFFKKRKIQRRGTKKSYWMQARDYSKSINFMIVASFT